MRISNVAGVAAAAFALMTSMGAALAHDESKYPDLRGQWRRGGTGGLLAGGAGGLRWDESRPPRRRPRSGSSRR